MEATRNDTLFVGRARELEAEARERGAAVLWGRCVDGDGFALGSPWADRDSLRLLRYVARLTAHARCLVPGTYRDASVGSAQSLDLLDTLATLRCNVTFRQVPVHGLSQQEVTACLRGAASQGFPRALAQAACAVNLAELKARLERGR